MADCEAGRLETGDLRNQELMNIWETGAEPGWIGSEQRQQNSHVQAQVACHTVKQRLNMRSNLLMGKQLHFVILQSKAHANDEVFKDGGHDEVWLRDGRQISIEDGLLGAEDELEVAAGEQSMVNGMREMAINV